MTHRLGDDPPIVDAIGGTELLQGIVTGGHGNETGRQISIYDVAGINERAVVAYLRQIIAENRAGGWRKLKRERGEA